MEKVFLISIIFNTLFLIFFKNIAKIINIYDIPSERKIHKKPVPILGGLLIYINLIIFIYFSNFFEVSLNDTLYLENIKSVLLFFFTTSSIFLLGLIDDKIDLSPNIRVIFLSVLIINHLYFDNNLLIEELTFSFLDLNLELNKISFMFTFFCIIVFIISANMFDGTNLQSSSFFIFILIYISITNLNLNIFCIFLVVSIIFFSIKNLKGKTFLGDGGSYLLSFILAYMLILTHKYTNIKSDEIAILIIFPIIDTLRLYFLRIINKKNPFLPDTNHFHHIVKKQFSNLFSILIIISFFLIPLLIFKIINNGIFTLILFLAIYFISVNVLNKRLKNMRLN